MTPYILHSDASQLGGICAKAKPIPFENSPNDFKFIKNCFNRMTEDMITFLPMNEEKNGMTSVTSSENVIKGNFKDLNDQMSRTADFLDKLHAHANQMEETRLGNHILKNLQAETISLDSPFNKTNSTPLPGIDPLFTKTELLQKLKATFSYSTNKMHPGGSLVLDLFDDQIEELFIKIASDPKWLKNSNQRVKLLLKEGTVSIKTYKEILKISKGNIKNLFGTLDSWQMQEGNIWRTTISLHKTHNTFEKMQKGFLKNYEEIKNQIELTNLRQFRYMEKILDTVGFLKDILIQEPDLLSNPLENDLDLSHHFERIIFRIKKFRNSLNDFERYFPDEYKICNYDLKFQEHWNQDKLILLEFCDKSQKLMTELNESTPYATDKLRSLYTYIIPFFEKKIGCKTFNFLKGKALDIENGDISKEDNLLLVFDSLSTANFWTFTSIIQETLILIFHHLIGASQLQFYELDPYMRELQKILTTLYNDPYIHIHEQFEAIKTKTLPPREIELLLSLEGAWKEGFLSIKKFVILPRIHLLETRIERCQTLQSSIELTFAIKDILDLSFKYRNAFKEFLGLMEIIGNDVAYKEKHSSEFENIYLDIGNVIQINIQSLQSAILHLENLLGRCFLNNSLQIETKKMTSETEARLNANLLIAQEKKTQRKKKKKPKDPSKNSSVQTLTNFASPIEKYAPPLAIVSDSNQIKIKRKKIKKKPKFLNELQSAQQDIQTIYGSIKGIKSIMIEGPDAAFRSKWRHGALKNLKQKISHLEETLNGSEFNQNKIFGETDTLRFILEATLEITLAQYPILISENSSVLHEARFNAHGLHMPIEKLLCHDHKSIPQNIRNIIHAYKSIAFALSSANVCINYLYSMTSNSLSPESKNLINYLIKVDQECNKEQANLSIRGDLLKTHQTLIFQGLRFTAELLQGILDSRYGLENYPNMEEDLIKFSGEDIFLLETSVDKEITPHLGELNLVSLNQDIKMLPIKNREDATQAISEALLWIRIHKLSPVEGNRESYFRLNQRNLALENIRLYLDWFQNKLDLKDSLSLYDRCCGEMSLIWRMHKELGIAALYHGDYYVEKKHIIQALELRHQNNPCYLHTILRSYSSHKDRLPNLYEKEMSWLQNAHKSLSYPFPLTVNEIQFMNDPIRHCLQSIKSLKKRRIELEKEEKFLDTDHSFTTIGAKGKLISMESIKNEKDILQMEAASLIEEIEREIVFPAFLKLLQVLRYGIPLPKIEWICPIES